MPQADPFVEPASWLVEGTLLLSAVLKKVGDNNAKKTSVENACRKTHPMPNSEMWKRDEAGLLTN